MRPLLDTNVLVDVALRRPGLHVASGATVAWCLNNPGSGLLAVHSLATFSYLVGRSAGPAKAREFIADLIEGTDIARLDNTEVKRALAFPMADFEDALIAAAAEGAGATHIVTRNTANFRRSPVKAVTPEDFVRLAAKA
ncbi:PIN domain-containing protein [Opitutus sp. GAS368]|uniref:type II toxin-antitoxin system VapC family toxin n=1 Tax=Opitutus sp. GAS368 TaxID=1882749 RepID=UPI00087A0319|nr:PIN domain-containing protein [Opitutus sp. GAS368]SDR74826.1 Predicted nucleic acid-binding protein, contains PIN domain [Opitutus sp. GAS368]